MGASLACLEQEHARRGDPSIDVAVPVRLEAELAEDVADLLLHRLLAPPQLPRDRPVAQAGGDELEDLPLARRERGQRPRSVAEDLLEQSGLDRRTPVEHALERRDEVADLEAA